MLELYPDVECTGLPIDDNAASLQKAAIEEWTVN